MPNKQLLTALSYYTATGPTPIKSMLSALLSTGCELPLEDIKGAAELLNKKLAELQNSKELHILYRIREDGTPAILQDSIGTELEIARDLKIAKQHWPNKDWRVGKILEL